MELDREYSLLIVDDESEIRETYSAYFRKRGFHVDTAVNGVEALAKLKAGEFDVTLVDLSMPEMGGIQLIEEVLKQGRIDTRFIVLTGHGGYEDAVKAIRLGAVYWFEKSNIDMAEVLAKVIDFAQIMPLRDVARLLGPILRDE
ncbi:MAG: response regulator [Anaerolineae bacterium]|jgi:DNA-binding NtrC family response regulator|nr:response regulator [Anaerolineae bacterium]